MVLDCLRVAVDVFEVVVGGEGVEIFEVVVGGLSSFLLLVLTSFSSYQRSPFSSW